MRWSCTDFPFLCPTMELFLVFSTTRKRTFLVLPLSAALAYNPTRAQSELPLQWYSEDRHQSVVLTPVLCNERKRRAGKSRTGALAQSAPRVEPWSKRTQLFRQSLSTADYPNRASIVPCSSPISECLKRC